MSHQRNEIQASNSQTEPQMSDQHHSEQNMQEIQHYKHPWINFLSVNNPQGFLDDRNSISHNLDVPVVMEVKESNGPQARHGLGQIPHCMILSLPAKKSWTFSTQCEQEWPFQNITSRVTKGCPLSFCVGAGGSTITRAIHHKNSPQWDKSLLWGERSTN